MIIAFDKKTFCDKKQALCELAFCRFPVQITIDDIVLVFEDFSTLEKYILSH